MYTGFLNGMNYSAYFLLHLKKIVAPYDIKDSDVDYFDLTILIL